MPRSKKKSHEATGRPTGRPAMVNLVLEMGHNINGTSYGPGPVRVDANVAATLTEQERNAKQYDRYMKTGGAGIIIPGAAGGVLIQPVDPAYFDQIHNAADPRIHVSGRR